MSPRPRLALSGHVIAVEGPVSCVLCRAEFQTQDAFAAHYARIHHGDAFIRVASYLLGLDGARDRVGVKS